MHEGWVSWWRSLRGQAYPIMVRRLPSRRGTQASPGGWVKLGNGECGWDSLAGLRWRWWVASRPPGLQAGRDDQLVASVFTAQVLRELGAMARMPGPQPSCLQDSGLDLDKKLEMGSLGRTRPADVHTAFCSVSCVCVCVCARGTGA
jgi:hypothetical protein